MRRIFRPLLITVCGIGFGACSEYDLKYADEKEEIELSPVDTGSLDRPDEEPPPEDLPEDEPPADTGELVEPPPEEPPPVEPPPEEPPPEEPPPEEPPPEEPPPEEPPPDEPPPEEPPPEEPPPEEPPALIPVVDVSPSEVDLGIVCGRAGEEVIVRNVGTGPLDVTGVVITGEDWTVTHVPLPVTLAPFEGLHISVSSRGGLGSITIETTDPENPSQVVPLSATQDAPPNVEIESPSSSEVLSPGGTTAFRAVVRDDVDMPEDLILEWRTDVEGLISSTPADADGVSTFEWDASEWASGDHRITVFATDSCDQRSEDVVEFCQNEGYTEESLALSSWNFEGDARWDAFNDWVELTQPLDFQAGTAFQTTAAVSSHDISIEFSFYVSGGNGADGISVTALDVGSMVSFVGDVGGGLGYAGLPGWSVEFDTYYNAHDHVDPTPEDHISIHIDGDAEAERLWVNVPDLEDGLWHEALVEVVGSHMRVVLDGVTYVDHDIDGLYAFDAYVGFTGATGELTNYHLIDALEVEGFVCE
jgi:hypothetical protein